MPRPAPAPATPAASAPATLTTAPTVAFAALLLAWPALLNGYPIVFSDTYGYLEQGIEAHIAWDKPWIYGPLIVPLHARLTLWPIVAAQALLLSTALWLTQRTLLAQARRTGHVLLAAALALASTAPWFAATVLPDSMTPLVPLGLFILAAGPGRLSRPTLAATALLTTVAIASHLSHLILAAACIALLALAALPGLRSFGPRPFWSTLTRTAPPLLAAMLALVGINAAGHGSPGISPYGSVFALARLVADGPAAETIRTHCPGSGWHLCAWKDRLPTDSDAFLWSPDGPMSTMEDGPIRLAPEARQVIALTVREHPLATAAAAARNMARQLALVRIGDTLSPDYLDVTVRETLRAYFPPAETRRFDAGLQARNRLRPLAEPFNPTFTALMAAGAVLTLLLAATARRHRTLAAFAALVLVAECANALATGALSGPHDRYQARIAWLVLLPPAFALLERLHAHKRSLTPEPRPALRPPPPAAGGSSAG